tara:strand:+ start:26 stop:148 length:123 start_codon:yes stop_codon:yes gene_type:complete
MSFIKAIWAVFGFNPDDDEIKVIVVDDEIEAVIDELGEEE